MQLVELQTPPAKFDFGLKIKLSFYQTESVVTNYKLRLFLVLFKESFSCYLLMRLTYHSVVIAVSVTRLCDGTAVTSPKMLYGNQKASIEGRILRSNSPEFLAIHRELLFAKSLQLLAILFSRNL